MCGLVIGQLQDYLKKNIFALNMCTPLCQFWNFGSKCDQVHFHNNKQIYVVIGLLDQYFWNSTLHSCSDVTTSILLSFPSLRHNWSRRDMRSCGTSILGMCWPAHPTWVLVCGLVYMLRSHWSAQINGLILSWRRCDCRNVEQVRTPSFYPWNKYCFTSILL